MSQPIFYLPSQHYPATESSSEHTSVSSTKENDPKGLVDRVFQSLRERFHGAHLIDDTLCGKYTYEGIQEKKSLTLHPDIQKVGFSKKELAQLSSIIASEPSHCHMSIPEVLVKVIYDHLKTQYPIKPKQAMISPSTLLLQQYLNTMSFFSSQSLFPDAISLKLVLPETMTKSELQQHLEGIVKDLEKKPDSNLPALQASKILIKITKAKEETFKNLTQFPCEVFSESPFISDVFSLQAYIAFCRQMLQAFAEPGGNNLTHLRSLEQLIDEAANISKSPKKLMKLSELTHKIFLESTSFHAHFSTLRKQASQAVPLAIRAPLPQFCSKAQKAVHDVNEALITLAGFDSCYLATQSTIDMNLESLIRRISFTLDFLYATDSNVAFPELSASLSFIASTIEKCSSISTLSISKQDLNTCLFNLYKSFSQSDSLEAFENKKSFINLFFESVDPSSLRRIAEEANRVYAELETEAPLSQGGFHPKVMHDPVYASFAVIKNDLRPHLNMAHLSKALKQLKKELDDRIQSKELGPLAKDELQQLRAALSVALTPCMISCILYADVKALIDNTSTSIDEIFPEELLELAFYGLEEADDEESVELEPPSHSVLQPPAPLPTASEQVNSHPIAESSEILAKSAKVDKVKKTAIPPSTASAAQKTAMATQEEPLSIQEPIVKIKKIRKIKTLLNSLARAGHLDFSKGSRQRGSHIQLPGGITIANHGGRQSIPLRTLQSIGAQVENAAKKKIKNR